MRRAFYFLFIAIITLLPYGSYASVVPIENVICNVNPSQQGDHDYTLLSFFDQTANVGKYAPPDLAVVDGVYMPDDRVLCLRENTYQAFMHMNAMMVIETGKGLLIRSGYRSFDEQEQFKEERGIFAAEAGRSEHQLGTAIDLIGLNTAEKFAESKEYIWMKENAHKYGFVQTYQEEYVGITGIPAEPWHWRYVGVETATKIKESGLDPNIFLYGLILKPDPGQSYQVRPQPFQVAHSANSLLPQQVS